MDNLQKYKRNGQYAGTNKDFKHVADALDTGPLVSLVGFVALCCWRRGRSTRDGSKGKEPLAFGRWSRRIGRLDSLPLSLSLSCSRSKGKKGRWEGLWGVRPTTRFRRGLNRRSD